MKPLFPYACLLSSLGLYSIAGVATPATAATSPANAALHAVAKKINAAESISFTAIVTRYKQSGSATAYRVTGRLAQPNYVDLKVTSTIQSSAAVPIVTINSDGTTYTAIDSAKSQYFTTDSPKDGIEAITPDTFYFVSHVLGDAGKVGFDAANNLSGADFDIASDPVPAGLKQTVTTTSKTVVIDGVRYEDVAEEVAGVKNTGIYATIFNPQTNQLAAVETYKVVKGAPQLTERIVYTLNTSSEPANAKQYACALPAGYQPFHAPGGAGSSAQDFTAFRPDGEPVHLSDFKGKVVVLDFWATWCPGCLNTLSGSDKLATQYKSQNVVFMPICTWDTRAHFDAWVPKHSTWTMSWLYDTAGENEAKSIAETGYFSPGIPTQYVIGKDGIIAFRGIAGTDAGEKPLIDAINKAMAAS